MKHAALILIFNLVFLGIGCERPAMPSTPPIGSGPQIPEDSLVPADSYSLTDLASHNIPEDCWVAVDGTVYDITEFPASHSGGAEAIIRWCGQDASKGFATKNDSNGSHSAKSKLNLDQFFKGLLVE